MDIYFRQGSRSQRSCGLMGGVGAILRPDERKMILKGGKDIRFQATPGQARTFLLISADTSWLGERGEGWGEAGRQNEERISPLVEENRGNQREEVILGSKKQLRKLLL